MICLGRPYPLKFFKGCHRQNLLIPVLNTLSHICPNFLSIRLVSLSAACGWISSMFPAISISGIKRNRSYTETLESKVQR